MTSVSQSGSTSPRWDNRNSGFISPAQLQQWKQQGRPSIDLRQASAVGDQSSAPNGSQADPNKQTPVSPPASPPANTHTRSVSAFSLFSKSKATSQDEHGSSSPQPQSLRQNERSTFNGSGRQMSRTPPPLESTPEKAPQSPGSTTTSEPLSPPLPAKDNQPGWGSSGAGPPLHPEIRSIVQLTLAHTRKIYFSGPLVRKLERQPDGRKPAKDEGWRDIWCQLGGTTLSIWDMQEVEEANKQGRQVPPSYVNVTDAVSNVYLCNFVNS